MEYYNPIDNTSKRYAAVVTVVAMAAMFACVWFATIDVERISHEEVIVELEYVEFEEVVEEPKPQEEPPQPVVPPTTEEAKVEMPEEMTPEVESSDLQPVQSYEDVAKDNVQNESSGDESKTQTVNQMALFQPSAGTTKDSEVVDGNTLANKGKEESRSGDGTGHNVKGKLELDAGLQGRGIIPGFPIPKGNNVMGKVTVVVIVDSDGNVVEATVSAKGTTTTDASLRENARQAALTTKFKPDPTRMTQQGTICYNYTVTTEAKN